MRFGFFKRERAARTFFAGVAGTLLSLGFSGCAFVAEKNFPAGRTPLESAENLDAQVAEIVANKIRGEIFSSAEVKNYTRFLLADLERKGVPAAEDLVPVAELTVVYAQELLGEYSSALAVAEKIAAVYPDSGFAAEAFYRMGTIYAARREFEKAFNCFSALEDSYPASVRVDDAIVQAYLVTEMVRNDVRPYKFGVIPWFRDRTSALGFYDRLYEMAPHLPISPRLLFHKGMFAFELSGEWFSFDKTLDAIDALERMISIYPDAAFVPEAYLELAKTYEAGIVGADWDQLSTRRAINYYTDFYSLFPEHAKAEFAYEKTVELTNLLAANRVVFGDFYYSRHNNLRAATTFYNEAVTLAPDSPAGAQARERLARIRRGERSERTIVDWIFGRYPAYDAKDYLDAPSQKPLDEMGFRGVPADAENSPDVPEGTPARENVPAGEN